MVQSVAFSTGATVDGDDWTRTDLKIVGRFTAGIFDGLEVRGQDATIPSSAGQVPLNRKAHQRIIRYEGMVMGSGSTEAAQRADFLASRIAIDGKMRGDQDPYTLTVTLEDGSTATIEARPLRVEWGPDNLPTYVEFIAYWLAVGDASAATPPDWTFGGS